MARPSQFRYSFLFVILVKILESSAQEDIDKLRFLQAIEILIPTVDAESAPCKNHSRLYLQELKNSRLWAMEMFDASSKFPTGVLSGSVYDLGNFDECMGIRVPLKEIDLQGKYCLAKFKMTSRNYVQGRSSYDIDNDPEQFNISAWEKVEAYSLDRSKGPRNEIHFSFCIPSSCTQMDLETTLRKQIGRFVSSGDFTVDATVQETDCQVEKEVIFNVGDIFFICIVVTFLLICILASVYHLLTKLDDLRQFQLPPGAHQLVKCFSIPSNLKKLAKKPHDDDGLECIHGMKVISMFLIIMGHRLMFEIGSPITNPTYVETFYKKIEATVLLNGPIIVDTFFNISGFLAAYLLLQELHKRNKPVNIIILYLHRFIRLTPAYAVVLAFYCTIFALLGSGPLWHDRIITEQERCLSSWWTNLLYINNYLNTDKICMFQSWYLTCDMHLFLLTPLLAYLLWKRPQAGIVTTSGLLFLSVAAVFLKVFISDDDGVLLLYIKMLRDPVSSTQFRTVYIPTHLRASPYFVGTLTGYLKYRMKHSGAKMPKVLVYCGWIACIFIMETTVYSAYLFYIPNVQRDPLYAALYSSMHHFTWSLCISWMIIAISSGNGSWITPIVSWRPMALLSRTTYAAFLCHGAVQIYSAAVLRQPKTVSIYNSLAATAADIVLSYVFGLILSQLFEAPILGLERILIRKGSRKAANEKDQQSDFNKTDDVQLAKAEEITRNGHRF